MPFGDRVVDPETLPVTVDDRERFSVVPALLARVPGVEVRTARLTAGDYDLGNGVVVERKTARGFVLSLMSGQLFAQAGALIDVCIANRAVTDSVRRSRRMTGESWALHACAGESGGRHDRGADSYPEESWPSHSTWSGSIPVLRG